MHNKHCPSLAASEVTRYEHKKKECEQCLQVVSHGGPRAVSDPLSPVYPCILKSLDGLPKSFFSHHPFSLNGDPEDRIERLVILIKKLLLKMVLSDHKVMQRCSYEMYSLISTMDHNRMMIWMIRKSKPVHDAAFWMMENLELCGDDFWNPLLAKSGVLHDDEYILSDDHYRIFDTCTILYNVLDYIHGPSSMQKDFKGTDSMFPEEYNMGPLLAKAENSTFLATVDKLLDALEHELIPYPEVVKIICGGEVNKRCSLCNSHVTVTEVIQFKKRLNRVGCFFNTMNMGMVRCAAHRCDLNQDNHPSRVDYQNWYPRVFWAFQRFKENRCHFCFKLSPHGVVHRCGKCLTKVYCSKDCQQEDWALVHSKICKGKGVQRKLKGKAKERKEAGDSTLRESLQRMEEHQLEDAIVGGYFDLRFYARFEGMLEDMMQRL